MWSRIVGDCSEKIGTVTHKSASGRPIIHKESYQFPYNLYIQNNFKD